MNINLIKPELKKAFELYDKADDLAKDWYLRTIGLKNEDRTIAMAYYFKASKERKILAEKINQLVEKGGDKCGENSKNV
jgi:hypothetical protein